MADNETTADIIAEIRRDANVHCSIPTKYLNAYADRLEAAHRREIEKITYAYDPAKAAKSKAPDPVAYAIEGFKKDPAAMRMYRQLNSGNAAKLREALVKARRFIDSSPLVCIVDDTGTIARGELCAEIDAALAAHATAEKSSVVGDAAKLRKALEFCADVLDDWGEGTGDMMRAARMAHSALAAPPRNCDVGTADDWLARFSVICERCSGSDCDHRIFKDEEVCDCFARWLQMPYKEGGAK